MKSSKLTIGQRVALGFALLLVLGAALGGFAALEMRGSATGATFLAEAVAPQTEVSSAIASRLASAQRAARTFGLTGDAAQLAATRKYVGELEESLGVARKLMGEQPRLMALREGVPEAERGLKNYIAEIEKMAANLAELDAIRAQLSASAKTFMTEIEAFIDYQDQRLAAEIVEGKPATELERRRLLVEMGNVVLDHGNAIQLQTYQAQALRRPALAEAALPVFSQLEDTRRKLVAESVDESARRQLGEVGTAANAYKVGVEALVKNFNANVAIANAQIAAGDEFAEVVSGVLTRSIDRTLAYASATATTLQTDADLIVVGLIVMVVVSLAAAFFIIRGVNRALTQTAEVLSQGSLQVAAAAGQVSSSSQTLAEGSSEQAASLEEISSSIEELASMTRRNAENAQSGKVSSGHARTAAEAGAAEMERMQAAMNSIQQSSNDISKIIKTIDEIAFQTNILALNAAVEAARAGEAGAGFAVVADEVRSLAQRSAVAAKETADKIVDATTRSAQGVELSTRVSAGLQEILAKSREVDRLVSEVATASNEQSEGISQINTAVTQMDKVTQSNAASAEETASAAEELNAQSEELRNASDKLAALVGVAAQPRDTHRAAGRAPAVTVREHKPAQSRARVITHPTVPTKARSEADQVETLSFRD